MNDFARRKLVEIVARNGRVVIENPRRLEALLRDYCGAYRREISVLVMAVEEHAVADLLAAPASSPRQILLARLAQGLCESLALSEDAARWAIESWALAFGVISEAEVSTTAAKTEKTGVADTANRAPTAVGEASTSSATQKDSAKKFLIIAADGSGDFNSINEALRRAAPDSRLLIREGLYRESVVIDKSVEIVGDGAFENIIIEGADSSVVLMQTGKAQMRGLTLKGRGAKNKKAFFAVEIPYGELTLENCVITSDSLSGIGIHGASANPAIKNCRIYDCRDSGLYIFDNASPQIEDCDIYRNANVNVAITDGARPLIKNCRIFEGANGGVVAWGNAAGTIENCSIYGHRLANVGVREDANPTFRDCEIYNGQDTGVFVHQNGYGIFENCRIHRNTQAEVGISGNANSVFRRCAIHDGENAGVIFKDHGQALIESCNIHDNRDAGIAVYGESRATVVRCNIHRNRDVAIRIKERSQARVENCDLRGNFLATWETEYGVTLVESGNREN